MQIKFVVTRITLEVEHSDEGVVRSGLVKLTDSEKPAFSYDASEATIHTTVELAKQLNLGDKFVLSLEPPTT